jgi:hypothetical protein
MIASVPEPMAAQRKRFRNGSDYIRKPIPSIKTYFEKGQIDN